MCWVQPWEAKSAAAGPADHLNGQVSREGCGQWETTCRPEQVLPTRVAEPD